MFARVAANRYLLGHDLDAVLEDLAPPAGPPRVDWRTALRAFAARAPGADWQRPNRRQPHRLLEVPGRTWRGSRPELLVAIDSSSSMGPGELGAVARELVPLAAGARITIVECDDTIRRVYPFAGRLDTICGRGGTDLRPPFAAELLRRHGRDGVVYFTDGQGPTPARPPAVPVLWVLTGDEPFDCAFGRRVALAVATADDDAWNIPF
jgi:predicted metal-dependent peptidase